MTPSVAPVLVAGSGPSGLAVALTLLQNGIPVRIIEKEPHHHPGQRGTGIWPRTLEVFHFLRTREIHQRSTPLLPIQEYKPGTLEITKTFSMVAHKDPTPSVPYSNPRIIGQPALEGILRSHLEKYGCFVELGTELESFEDDGTQVVAKLIKRNQDDGEETTEVFEASYLIGADGARGVTRKQLGFTFLGETEDFHSVTGDICLDVEGGKLDREHWHIFGDRSLNILTLRPTDEVAPDGFQFFLSVKGYDPKQLLADEKLMFKCMSEVIGHEVNVRKVVIMSEYHPNVRMADKLSRGRVFIVGDAAHVHSPTGGQGLNTCVQDAFNLAWKLSLVYKGLSPSLLLDSYAEERLPVIAEMLNITTGILHKMLSGPTAERAVERPELLNMLGVNYRRSSIVVDEFTRAEPVNAYKGLDEATLVAGDRAPDAPGLVVAGSETRLFEVFSPTYHTVLVFAPDVASAADVLEESKKFTEGITRLVVVLPQGSEVTMVAHTDIAVDRDGHAYLGFLAVAGEKKVVIVRPDGVVGAIVHGAEGVKVYFANIFI